MGDVPSSTMRSFIGNAPGCPKKIIGRFGTCLKPVSRSWHSGVHSGVVFKPDGRVQASCWMFKIPGPCWNIEPLDEFAIVMLYSIEVFSASIYSSSCS